MKKCNRCGSYAVNPGRSGRDESSDLDLCDVCYWRKRAEQAAEIEREACAKVCDEISSDYCTRELRRFAELRTDAEIGAGKCAAEIRARGAKGGE